MSGTGGLGSLDLGNGQTEVRATLMGDTNLDGHVDISDLSNFAVNFGKTSGATWLMGDFNYDGRVDITDLSDFANNLGKGLTATTGSANVAATAASVPEPAVGLVALLSLVGGVLLAAPRRRSRQRRRRYDSA
jgi:hypothetical protein